MTSAHFSMPLEVEAASLEELCYQLKRKCIYVIRLFMHSNYYCLFFY